MYVGMYIIIKLFSYTERIARFKMNAVQWVLDLYSLWVKIGQSESGSKNSAW